jgi:hypothetical protein
MRLPFIATPNERCDTNDRRSVNRWWWRHTWRCWVAVGAQAKEWRCSRLYVITIAVSDMLKVDRLSRAKQDLRLANLRIVK